MVDTTSVVHAINLQVGVVPTMNLQRGVVSTINLQLGVVPTEHLQLGVVSTVNLQLCAVPTINLQVGVVTETDAILTSFHAALEPRPSIATTMMWPSLAVVLGWCDAVMLRRCAGVTLEEVRLYHCDSAAVSSDGRL